MAPHIIWTDTEEKAGLNVMLVKDIQQLWNTLFCTSISIHIDSQANFLHYLLPNSSTAPRKKKSNVSSTVWRVSIVGFQSNRRSAFLMLGLRCSTS